MHPGVKWAVAAMSLTALDIWCDRNDVPGDTLSEVTRAAFRTETTLGRAAFIGAWSALTAVLVPHICHAVEDASS